MLLQVEKSQNWLVEMKEHLGFEMHSKDKLRNDIDGEQKIILRHELYIFLEIHD